VWSSVSDHFNELLEKYPRIKTGKGMVFAFSIIPTNLFLKNLFKAADPAALFI
jgi:hypothetical protein